MADTEVRFELGFRGGGQAGGVIPVAEWERLRQALAAGSGVVEVSGGSERWWVRVEDVVYAVRQERDKRPGFTR